MILQSAIQRAGIGVAVKVAATSIGPRPEFAACSAFGILVIDPGKTAAAVNGLLCGIEGHFHGEWVSSGAGMGCIIDVIGTVALATGKAILAGGAAGCQVFIAGGQLSHLIMGTVIAQQGWRIMTIVTVTTGKSNVVLMALGTADILAVGLAALSTVAIVLGLGMTGFANAVIPGRVIRTGTVTEKTETSGIVPRNFTGICFADCVIELELDADVATPGSPQVFANKVNIAGLVRRVAGETIDGPVPIFPTGMLA